MRKFFFTQVIVFLVLNVTAQKNSLQFWRSYDKRGINVFETEKKDTVSFTELKVRIGGAFAQPFQNLRHSNTAVSKFDASSRNINQLMEIGPGFNLASANLYLDVQLADGVRMNVTTYLSSRHHPEAWVKGGYLQFDKLTFLKNQFVDRLMNYFTIRAGHYEINYGDAHYRRSDNGNVMYNPFIESYIMDAFTTEIGGELFFQHRGWLAMAACTNGEINGAVTNPGKRNPAFIGKIGFDKKLIKDLRLRLTSSVYTSEGSNNNTLYGGDRAGSRYNMVMENILATSSVNAFSGRLNPGFNRNITAIVINPFIKYKGIELFANLEQATGRSSVDTEKRTWRQIGLDIIYRFGKEEQFYVAARYNQAKGKLQNLNNNLVIERAQAGCGWFVTKNILAKFEAVNQVYENFDVKDIRNGGKFYGFMLEACIAF